MSIRYWIAALLTAALASLSGPAIAQQAQPPLRERHALILGVSTYKDGVPRLKGPRNDARRMKEVLEHPDIGFKVTLLEEAKITTKAAFKEALSAFTRDIPSNSEVLFYFSGHGFNLDGANYFLLGDARSQDRYIESLTKERSVTLRTEAERHGEYRKWVKQVALSEAEIEDELYRKAEITFIIADACRSEPQKGFTPFKDGEGLISPRDVKSKVFRWYAASPGEAAYDVLDDDPVESESRSEGRSDSRGRSSGSARSEERSNSSNTSSSSRSGRDARRNLSLFTSVLSRNLFARIDFLELHGRITRQVIDLSNQRAPKSQTPNLVHGAGPTGFFFNRNRRQPIGDAACTSAQLELDRLRTGLVNNSVSRDEIERKRDDLSDCGLAAQVDELLNQQRLGIGGSIYAEDAEFPIQDSGLMEATERCDRYASSPFDPDRLQQHPPADIQRFAQEALGGGVNAVLARQRIQSIADACDAAIKERPRNARYRYNRARAYYALATLAGPLVDRTQLLFEASTSNQDAADAGYVAAFNNLAIMHKSGQFHATVDGAIKMQPVNLQRASSLLLRGANLGHPIAQYNLGIAIRNGDPGTETPTAVGGATTATTREARAFEQLSKSAEQGYMPAIIETALALHNGRGVTQRNPERALEMFELAASRGSREAMYYLGEIYRVGAGSGDPSQAILWHARAAEAGGTGSQAKLAEMLSDGIGIPVVESNAAGRYWRLAADGGNRDAQHRLALLLRDGKVRSRPRADDADGGAREILDLLTTAFARGEPKAGLELARLYRKGFPEGRPSKALPKDPGKAVQFLLDTISAVRNADPWTRAANPLNEYEAAAELMSMFETGDSRREGQNMITDDQYEQLQAEYGRDKQRTWVRAAAAAGAGITCPRRKFDYDTPAAEDLWVLVWNSRSAINPVEQQFDWYERIHRCRTRHEGNKDAKPEMLGVSKPVRDAFAREYQAWLDDKDAKKTYVDRMVDLVNRGVTSEKRSNRRR